MELVEPSGVIDLDAVATVTPEPEVVAAMRPWLDVRHAHPDSPHSRGAGARRAIEAARADVAALVGRRAEDIVFTSGGTEANNLAIRGVLALALRKGAARIAIAAHEHASLLHPCRSLARAGARLDLLAVGRDGLVPPASVAAEDLSLLAFSHAHPELGAVQASAELVERARRAGAASLVDAAFTLGRIASDVDSLGDPELIALSFHRMGGPMGVGALAARAGVCLTPLLEGGIQENGIRPGTPNLAGIIGAGVASRRALQTLAERQRRLARLGSQLSAGVLSIPGVRGSGPPIDRRLPGHVSIVVDGVDGEALVSALDARGILAATGSACADAVGLPSAALLAAGFARDEARGAVVLCIPPVGGLQEREVTQAVAAIRAEIGQLRRIAGCVAPPEA